MKVQNYSNPIVIASATPTSEGVMSAADKAALDALLSVTPSPVPIPNTRVANLLENTPTPLVKVDMDLCPDNSFGSILYFSCEVTDGSDVQVVTGELNANLVRKGASITGSTATDTTTAKTAGSLNVTFDWVVVGAVATLRVSYATSLTPTDAHINFFVSFETHNAMSLV